MRKIETYKFVLWGAALLLLCKYSLTDFKVLLSKAGEVMFPVFVGLMLTLVLYAPEKKDRAYAIRLGKTFF